MLAGLILIIVISIYMLGHKERPATPMTEPD